MKHHISFLLILGMYALVDWAMTPMTQIYLSGSQGLTSHLSCDGMRFNGRYMALGIGLTGTGNNGLKKSLRIQR